MNITQKSLTFLNSLRALKQWGEVQYGYHAKKLSLHYKKISLRYHEAKFEHLKNVIDFFVKQDDPDNLDRTLSLLSPNDPIFSWLRQEHCSKSSSNSVASTNNSVTSPKSARVPSKNFANHRFFDEAQSAKIVSILNRFSATQDNIRPRIEKVVDLKQIDLFEAFINCSFLSLDDKHAIFAYLLDEGLRHDDIALDQSFYWHAIELLLQSNYDCTARSESRTIPIFYIAEKSQDFSPINPIHFDSLQKIIGLLINRHVDIFSFINHRTGEKNPPTAIYPPYESCENESIFNEILFKTVEPTINMVISHYKDSYETLDFMEQSIVNIQKFYSINSRDFCIDFIHDLKNQLSIKKEQENLIQEIPTQEKKTSSKNRI